MVTKLESAPVREVEHCEFSPNTLYFNIIGTRSVCLFSENANTTHLPRKFSNIGIPAAIQYVFTVFSSPNAFIVSRYTLILGGATVSLFPIDFILAVGALTKIASSVVQPVMALMINLRLPQPVPSIKEKAVHVKGYGLTTYRLYSYRITSVAAFLNDGSPTEFFDKRSILSMDRYSVSICRLY
jgi:hypothetical protein